ncbi:ribosomal protein S18 acetylase RimI-like enzyme [Neorhizobium galegae]|uniref:GNAT family N-acetyltransferase n=1 Tax=Neorhizobium galegae TaxID=399 RepID=UPI001AE3BDC3|nr:GNAT family N-acetyltransferase [Neorhizobium galegae]MBP2549105.1 ribosomal protein S18 acetylase RimI-like enzyme [Neorhizobium galegae]
MTCLRRLTLADMAKAARVHRTSFDARLPDLAGLHTPAEDCAYWCEHLFVTCCIWGVEAGGLLLGVIAFRQGAIEQLYVLPQTQGRGIGTILLQKAKAEHDLLDLWTFQQNIRARLFYEKHGFVAIEETDGRGNEERAPDMRYRWQRLADDGLQAGLAAT